MLRLIRLVLGCLVLTTALTTAVTVRADDSCPARDVRVIGHRGTGTNGVSPGPPENTIASFLQGATEGATMVELDVQLDLDGVLYVMHDDTVDRTTDGTGCVASLTSAEMDALDADGESVPTLEAVLAAVDTDLNIEIKVTDDPSCPETDRLNLATELARVLAADPTPREILVSSFDLDQLLAVRGVDDTIRLAFLALDRSGFDTAITEELAAVHPIALGIRADDVERAHAAGVLVNPWTVNDEVDYRRVIATGVDGIITDEPDLMATTIEAICVEACLDAGPGDAGGLDGGVSDAGTDAGSGGGGGGCTTSGGSEASWVLLVIVALRRRR